jgi:hypothetical protein
MHQQRFCAYVALAAIVGGTLAACHSHEVAKRGLDNQRRSEAPVAMPLLQSVPPMPAPPVTADDTPITPMETVGAPAER